MGFFLGGGFAGRFERWSISSHIRVQITSELVRSIALIGLNMFSTHNVSDKSLKIFLRPRFWRSVLKKWLNGPRKIPWKQQQNDDSVKWIYQDPTINYNSQNELRYMFLNGKHQNLIPQKILGIRTHPKELRPSYKPLMWG